MVVVGTRRPFLLLGHVQKNYSAEPSKNIPCGQSTDYPSACNSSMADRYDVLEFGLENTVAHMLISRALFEIYFATSTGP